MTWTNWGRNQSVSPRRVERASSAHDVAAVVREAVRRGQRVKAVGAGHSFSPIAVPDDVQLTLEAGSAGVDIDAETGLCVVSAGLELHRLNRLLWASGLSMQNLGDIEAQTVAGAISTGTHGTGARKQGLAAQVRAVEMVLGDGEIVTCSPEHDAELFSAARVGLGALGIMTRVTLQCEPAYYLEAAEESMPLDEVLRRLDELADASDHFEFFWFPHTSIALTKRNTRLAHKPPVTRSPRRAAADSLVQNGVHGLFCRAGARLPGQVPNLNRWLARGAWPARYAGPSYEVFTSARRVRFVETEYAIPREAIHEALARVRTLTETHARHVTFPLEIRFAAADDIPLSTASGRDSAYIAAHVYRGQPYQAYFDAFEAVMSDYGGRPHWGKMHSLTAGQLRSRYPRFGQFLAVRDRADPAGTFRNLYLDRVLGLPASGPPAGAV
ncbi:MAG TPA: D-arabinono-1,4-lactone oxidase [Streptosporangiaceae bacterium]|jgi:FAD-linked oxidoreductase